MFTDGSDSLNVYRPASLVDHVDKNANLTEEEWQKDITGDTLYQLQIPKVNIMRKLLQKLSQTNLKIILSPRVLLNGNGNTVDCICFNWRF